MSASGKSRNRQAEHHRGYHHGGGNGPYAAQGRRDRAAQDALRRPDPDTGRDSPKDNEKEGNAHA